MQSDIMDPHPSTPDSHIPLLLTSSIIAHDRGVNLKDTDARLHHALESVEQWLRISPNLSIVLCDGSDFDLKPFVTQKFPAARIECISFENDQNMVQTYGRGFGEGEIIKYALRHSCFIAEAGCFAKCSSKLWVENFEECKHYWNGHLLCKGVFLNVFSPWTKTVLQHIDTRFYISSVSAYEQFFVDAHRQIDVAAGHGLEECFLDAFLKHDIQHGLLPAAPIINGVGGGTGHYYRNTGKRILKEKLRLHLVRKNPEFKSLFSSVTPARP